MPKTFRVFHGDVDADGALTSRRANVVLQKRLQLYCTYDDDDDTRRRLALRARFFRRFRKRHGLFAFSSAK